jgi:hypothetical protein
MSVLQEIMQLLNGVEVKADKLVEKTPKIEKASSSLRDAERLALRWLAIGKKLGLPEQIEQATQVITTLIVMLKMLEISLASMSGGGLRALIGLAGVISVTLTAYDMIGYDASRGY